MIHRTILIEDKDNPKLRVSLVAFISFEYLCSYEAFLFIFTILHTLIISHILAYFSLL